MTAPTPPTIPEQSSASTALKVPSLSHHSLTAGSIHSPMNTSFTQSVHHVPIPTISKSPQANPMMPKNTTAMTPMKIGIPQILWVTILSTLSENVPRSSLGAFLTAADAMSVILLYLPSATMESASSSFFSSSSLTTPEILSTASGNSSQTALSFSTSFTA